MRIDSETGRKGKWAGRLTVDDQSFDADMLEREMKGLARRAGVVNDATGWGHGEGERGAW